MITSLMVIPGLSYGNPEWMDEYYRGCRILDAQMEKIQESLLSSVFFCLPSGVVPHPYRAGW